ncbi:tautomerase family protein [Paenibacillus sp. FSL H8-0332]|uniref:tautomerase family protein n=1 Tax=Paenibacillus sp. FSL H8-0332 TaxID=2954742 RepID=UPI0030CBB16A
MPFVRVSYLENKYDAQQLPIISREIMNALREHFNVPQDDFFQVFHAHKASEFYYSPSYLNIERTDGLLYIQITLKSGRSQEQKRGFYSKLAETLSSTLGIRKEDVFVVLVDTEFEDWTFGNGITQMIE